MKERKLVTGGRQYGSFFSTPGTHGGKAYHIHVCAHWNHYVTTDQAIRALVEYESGPDGDISRFATRLLGRHVIESKSENEKGTSQD